MDKKEPKDLRDGLKGSLQVPEPPLAGAEPMHRLQDAPAVAPGSPTSTGQATHE
ncbi:MAG: hypothetical protein J0G99_04025 [Alphaproteobacteria bacterium]|nr:hypothetical protein [Alphaproteobacteria bacterium]